jgi:hypothetical protein
VSERTRISRRIAVGAVAAFAGLAIAVREVPKLLGHRHRSGPFADVLSAIDDPDSAAQFGRSCLAACQGFEPQVVANLLRARLKNLPLADLMQKEASEARIVEVGGWIIPESLALLCALEARA